MKKAPDISKCNDTIARCPDCGAVVFVCVNHPDVLRDSKKDIADLVMHGYTVSTITHEQFKKEERFGHDANCRRKKIHQPEKSTEQLQLVG